MSLRLYCTKHIRKTSLLLFVLNSPFITDAKKKKEILLQAQQVQSNSDILMSPYKFHLK